MRLERDVGKMVGRAPKHPEELHDDVFIDDMIKE